MNILITGIHGFVGSNLVAALKGQHTIYGLDIVSPTVDGVTNTFAWNEMGIIPIVDVVIHLAGKAHDTKDKTQTQVYFDINTGLTKKVFDWFLDSGSTKFIHFSSVKAVADSINEILIEEINPIPKGPYGESKLAAEKYLREKSGEGVMGGLAYKGVLHTSSTTTARQRPLSNPREKKIYVLRPCMIHGPGNKGNFHLLYKIASKGIPWPLGIYENKRSFASIANLQFVVQQLVENNIASGTYNVADDQPLSTNELIRLIAASQGKKARIWKINPRLIILLARLGDKLHLPLNNERLTKLTESYIVSNCKLKKALNIERMPLSAEEGMKKTLKQYNK